MSKLREQWAAWNEERSRWVKRLLVWPKPNINEWIDHMERLERAAPRTERGEMNLRAVDYLGWLGETLARWLEEEVNAPPST